MRKFLFLLAILLGSLSCRSRIPCPGAALEVLAWLESAIDTLDDGRELVRERYDMASRRWISLYRPDCNIETAYAFLCAWEAHTQ